MLKMNESKILGVSFRGILALVVIAVVCAMSYMGKKVDEPLYTLVLVVSSAYFGSKGMPNGNGEKKNEPSKQI